MEYNKEKKEIILNRTLSELDLFVIEFLKVLKKYSDYCIISGYISILLGRSRATEDVDMFLEKISFEKFFPLFNDLKSSGFECLNTDTPNEAYQYLKDGSAIRFSRIGLPIPNFEVKFPKRKIDDETFQDFLIVKISNNDIKISSLERQIAFKRYFLKSDKDIEDAVHIEELFKDKLDYEKINKFKMIIKSMDK